MGLKSGGQASESCVTIVHLYFVLSDIFFKVLFIIYIGTVCTVGT